MHVTIRSNKGFSLVELMVVVAIIGILAAIAIPNFQRFTAKSKQSEAKAELAMMYATQKAFAAEWQQYVGSFSVQGYSPTGTMRYEHGASADFGGTLAALGPTYSAAGPFTKGDFNTATYCPANGCFISQVPVAPGGVAGAAVAINTFTLQARGDLTGGASPIDVWTIDQTKALKNTANGLP